MKTLIKILTKLIIFFYKYKLRTGNITYVYYLKNLYFCLTICSFLYFIFIFFEFIFLNKYLYFNYFTEFDWQRKSTFLYVDYRNRYPDFIYTSFENNKYINVNSTEYLLFFFFLSNNILNIFYFINKLLFFFNLTLLFFHIYYAIEHILCDYIKNINKNLTYIYFKFILIFIYILFLKYYCNFSILDVTNTYINLKNIFYILFIILINFFFIEQSLFLLTKQTNKNIYYYLINYLQLVILYIIASFSILSIIYIFIYIDYSSFWIIEELFIFNFWKYNIYFEWWINIYINIYSFLYYNINIFFDFCVVFIKNLKLI
jgi:hypothetical protein